MKIEEQCRLLATTALRKREHSRITLRKAEECLQVLITHFDVLIFLVATVQLTRSHRPVPHRVLFLASHPNATVSLTEKNEEINY
jgi:hypothetical protein